MVFKMASPYCKSAHEAILGVVGDLVLLGLKLELRILLTVVVN